MSCQTKKMTGISDDLKKRTEKNQGGMIDMVCLKRFIGTMGICAALLASGCGLSNENEDLSAQDSSAVLSVGAEDASDPIRKNAEKGSLDTFDGKYQVQDADGVCYYFDEDGLCYYVQQGTYSFSHDLNADGVEADMIAMQFDTQSAPTNYTIEQEQEQLILKTTYSGAESETSMELAFVTGVDGIAEMEPFEGIYSAFSSEDYRYEFHSDGTFYMILEESYAIDGSTLTLSAFGNSLTYDYEVVDEKIQLTSDGVEIAVLVPVE